MKGEKMCSVKTRRKQTRKENETNFFTAPVSSSIMSTRRPGQFNVTYTVGCCSTSCACTSLSPSAVHIATNNSKSVGKDIAGVRRALTAKDNAAGAAGAAAVAPIAEAERDDDILVVIIICLIDSMQDISYDNTVQVRVYLPQSLLHNL